MIVLERIQPEDIERLWFHVKPLIQAGCDAVTTENTAEFVKAEALANRRTIWCVFDTADPFPFLAAFATGERLTNRGRVVFIDVIGGRNRGCWLTQSLAELEAQAKAKGVVSIELEGRRGWRRVLPGYREVRTVMEKIL
jgi:hypothetical protein